MEQAVDGKRVAAEMLARVRRARQRRAVSLAQASILEAQALGTLGRHGEAAARLARALGRQDVHADDRALLRAARAEALAGADRPREARAEADRALAEAVGPAARGRALEVRGRLALVVDSALAARCLESAALVYEAIGDHAGEARTLAHSVQRLRGGGCLQEALVLAGRWVEAATDEPGAATLAEALAAEGLVLRDLGRWADARSRLGEAARLFGDAGDPRQATLAGLGLASVEMADGDLASARAAVERAAATVGAGDARTRGEILLAEADLELASARADSAQAAAARAVALFSVAADPEGVCRSRVRLASALLAGGRGAAALQEARRARRAVPPGHESLACLSSLALGRVLLRRGLDAEEVMGEALRMAGGRPAFAAMARLGLALADGAGRDDARVVESFEALRAWGDRRLLAMCLAEVRALRGGAPSEAALPVAVASVRPSSGRVGSLVAALQALDGSGDAVERWAEAVRALRPLVPWRRAALVGASAWDLGARPGGGRDLADGDLAHAVVGDAQGPSLVDLGGERWRDHPVRVQHDLRTALVVPAVAGVLYLDVAAGVDFAAEEALEALVALAAHGPVPVEDAAPPAVFEGLVGESAPMRELFASIEAAARSSAAVHIVGETGTGKEKVAEALHARSARSRGPFVAVNASSFTDDLFESEMFGHARGAFTGAVADRAGVVEEAEGGTLLLDEVTDLSKRAQSKLLRFLQTKEYRRVGETRVRRANVRVVTAANVALQERVAAGTFRQDLVYRIAVLTVPVPALREREGDVLRLAAHFLRAGAREEGRAVPALPSDVARALQAHSWPGNVRELQNVVAQLLAVSRGGRLRRDALSLGSPGAATAMAAGPLREAVVQFERDYIGRALAEHAGNKSKTAWTLGLSRQGLILKMNRLGLA